MLRIAAVALVLLIFASSANGQSRIALLIGNESYVSKVGPLKNPHNDIRVIGAALRTLGLRSPRSETPTIARSIPPSNVTSPRFAARAKES
jgi:hypothetical protein